jgi:hypothetical protein
MSKISANPNTHILYTRTLNHPYKAFLSAALNSDPTHRKWKVSYKGVIIGEVRIKNDFEEDDDVYSYSDTKA